MGTRRDHRRLRASDSHDSSRRHHRAAADRQRRRPAPHGLGGAHARGLQARRRPDEISRADQGRPARRGSRGSCITAPGSVFPASRRPPGRVLRVNSRRLRRAARQDLQRNRHRSAQHAQVPGHGAAARAAVAERDGFVSARRDDVAGAAAEGRDLAVRRRRQQHRRARGICGPAARRRSSTKA